jgi:hypothetical protein
MGIWLQEFKKDAKRITFCEGRESAETSTRNVNRRVEDGGVRSSDGKQRLRPNVTYLRGAGYQGFHAGWHATLRTTTVGYGGAAVGLQHAVYRWRATQAL